MKKLVAEVRTTYGVKSIGCEGFCWGGHYTTFLLGPPIPHLLFCAVLTRDGQSC